jgi:hypothetical protein
VFTFMDARLRRSGFAEPRTPERLRSCLTELSEPLLLLAEGGAFHFQVSPTYEWRAYADSLDEVRDRAAALQGYARRCAIRLVRPLAREFQPHRIKDFESAANKRLDAQWRNLSAIDGDDIWYLITVRVEADERVQEHLRPYWEKRMKADFQHDLDLLRAERADALTRRWSEIFDLLEKDPRALHAAKLTEEGFATVFGTFVDDKNKALRSLLDLLRDAVKGHDDARLGPSEYTRAWDEALKAFQQQYGLKVGKFDQA